VNQNFLDSSDCGSIFLVGFMGSGKTTVGRKLAKKLNFRFQDLDDLIEMRAGKTVSAIFADHGEAYFRELEREALRECRSMKRTVVALGGGAFVSAINRETLEGIGPTVWLDCPLDVCLARLAGDRSRPLLASKIDLGSLYAMRRAAYENASIVVQSGGRPPEEITLEIIEALRSVGS
jgi:shikimate kinase